VVVSTRETKDNTGTVVDVQLGSVIARPSAKKQ
jgi:hypothetical protein